MGEWLLGMDCDFSHVWISVSQCYIDVTGYVLNVCLPDLFLHSISYPVMGLLPSKPMVQRRAMVRSLTSRISTSGGSGGSEGKCEHNRVRATVLK